MKKFFTLIYLIIFAFFLILPLKSRAIETNISVTPANNAKVGDKVEIVYTVYNDDPKAQWILLRIYDPKYIGDESMYSAKDKDPVPNLNTTGRYTYTWDTKAAGSNPGDHRIDVVVTENDELKELNAISYAELYKLLPADGETPTPSNSASAGGTPSPTITGGSDLNKSLFPSNPERWTLETIFEIINNILTFVSIGAGALAVFMIVWFGFGYFMALGSEEKIEAAKKGILYTLSGLGVIILAKTLVAFLLSVFQ